jgi:hypothetical protein
VGERARRAKMTTGGSFFASNGEQTANNLGHR